MEARLTEEMMEALAQPFPVEAIQWKPGATNQDKTRGLALAYVDLRHYIDRLNEVAGPDWSDDYEVQAGGTVVLCRLTIAGVTRADVGEASSNDENTATSALAQAYKRACVKFGLGAYLYRLPRMWVEYDAQRKGFTDAALAKLAKLAGGPGPAKPAAGGNGDRPEGAKVNGNGDQPAPTPTPDTAKVNGNGANGNGKAGPTEFWLAAKELGIDKAKAQGIASGVGTWSEKVAALRD